MAGRILENMTGGREREIEMGGSWVGRKHLGCS
jgi:hypothetical protein